MPLDFDHLAPVLILMSSTLVRQDSRVCAYTERSTAGVDTYFNSEDQCFANLWERSLCAFSS